MLTDGKKRTKVHEDEPSLFSWLVQGCNGDTICWAVGDRLIYHLEEPVGNGLAMFALDAEYIVSHILCFLSTGTSPCATE